MSSHRQQQKQKMQHAQPHAISAQQLDDSNQHIHAKHAGGHGLTASSRSLSTHQQGDFANNNNNNTQQGYHARAEDNILVHNDSRHIPGYSGFIPGTREAVGKTFGDTLRTYATTSFGHQQKRQDLDGAAAVEALNDSLITSSSSGTAAAIPIPGYQGFLARSQAIVGRGHTETIQLAHAVDASHRKAEREHQAGLLTALGVATPGKSSKGEEQQQHREALRRHDFREHVPASPIGAERTADRDSDHRHVSRSPSPHRSPGKTYHQVALSELTADDRNLDSHFRHPLIANRQPNSLPSFLKCSRHDGWCECKREADALSSSAVDSSEHQDKCSSNSSSTNSHCRQQQEREGELDQGYIYAPYSSEQHRNEVHREKRAKEEKREQAALTLLPWQRDEKQAEREERECKQNQSLGAHEAITPLHAQKEVKREHLRAADSEQEQPQQQEKHFLTGFTGHIPRHEHYFGVNSKELHEQALRHFQHDVDAHARDTTLSAVRDPNRFYQDHHHASPQGHQASSSRNNRLETYSTSTARYRDYSLDAKRQASGEVCCTTLKACDACRGRQHDACQDGKKEGEEGEREEVNILMQKPIPGYSGHIPHRHGH